MKWKWWFILATSYQSGPSETWRLCSENLRGADPRALASSTCLWICHNCQLIYAASWMQLFPMSTVVKKRGDADSLKTDRMPLLVFIWGACHQYVDWRWMLCWEACWALWTWGPVGSATFHAFISSTTISSFSSLLCAVCRSCWELSQLAALVLFYLLLNLAFHLHTFLFSSPIPLSFSVLHLRGQAPALLAPRFPFDRPNSLFTSPRHKRHQADWSAGMSQGTADQWGLGQRGRRREDGWREAKEEEGEGWTGRLTDAQSAAQSMGTFAELR